MKTTEQLYILDAICTLNDICSIFDVDSDVFLIASFTVRFFERIFDDLDRKEHEDVC